MPLLQEIQEAAIDSQVEIGVVLRKCLVLASRLRNAELQHWVERELNGYPEERELPPYRVVNEACNVGHFLGPFGRQLRNAPLAMGSVKSKNIRAAYSKLCFTQPIISYELAAKEGKDCEFPWNQNAVLLETDNFYSGLQLVQAWQEIPSSVLVSLVETVRNRILSFALEIEEQVGVAGDLSSANPKEVHQSFHTHIYGPVGNVAQGSQNVRLESRIGISLGDLKSLRQYLLSLEIPTEDVDDLESAIEQDAEAGKTDGPGDSVNSWVGRMLEKARSGGWSVGVQTAANLLTQAIAKFFSG